MSKLKVKKIESIDKDPLVVVGDIIISGSMTTNNIVLFSGGTLFSGNTSSNPLSNLWVSDDVHANTFYGDGTNLTGIPVYSSVGNKSLKQVGSSYEKNSFGTSSASLGDFNSSNGDYSVTLGFDNKTGSNEYDFLYSYDNRYGIILDNNASKDFSNKQIVQSFSTTAVTTGSTVISSSTIICDTVIISSGVTGCTCTATTTTTTIITGSTQVVTSNPSNPLCVKYKISHQSIFNNNPVRILITDCNSGLKTAYFSTANTTTYVCSSSFPVIDPRTNLTINLIDIRQFSLCCECIEYTMEPKYFLGGPFIHPIYLNYIPCGSSTPVDIPYVSGGTVCMSPANISTHYFYEIPYFLPSPVYNIFPRNSGPFYLKNTNVCCSPPINSYVISSSTTVTTNISTVSACTGSSIVIITNTETDGELFMTTENVYGNCELYDEYSEVTYPLNIISVQTGNSNDGTIKTLDGKILYTGLTNLDNGYIVLEFENSLPEQYFNKIISKSISNSTIATGNNTEAKGNYSFSQNKNTISNGDYSHAEGLETISNGLASHSEGYLTKANGDYSNAKGIGTTANGTASNSDGYYTIANGNFSKSKGINTTSNGYASTSDGFNSVSNGDFSNALGNNVTTGSKQYDIPQVINGKYVLFLEDVSDQFVTNNLKYETVNTTLSTGTTITTTTEVTYEIELIGSSIEGCINYILANNTSSVITFTYTDCETGLSAQTQVDFYDTKSICSLTEPAYTSFPWMSAYTYPVVITEIGTCCNEIEVTTATTVTVTTTIVTSAVTEPYFNNCNTYQLTNNIYPYTYDVFYTSCTGNLEFIVLTDRVTTICASSTPTRFNNLPLPTAVTVTQISNECCISYNIYNPAWCPITAFYTDCHTGLSASTTISGYLSASVCSLTEPTFDTTCWSSLGYNPSIYSPRVTRNSNNSSCQIQNIQVVSSSVTTNTTYEITSACTEENIYFTGLTGCTNYIITGESPLLIYTDCFGQYRSFSVVTGETYTICSSNYPVVPTANILDVEIVPTGNCETLCVNYRFTKGYDTTIPPIWDVYYVDCNFNPQTVTLKNVGDSFETCIILGSELYGTNISVTQLSSCSQHSSQRNVNTSTSTFGGEIIISELKLTNGTVFNGTNKYPINVTQIYTGVTSGEFFTGITGVTVYISGFTGTSNYTILELNDDLPLEFQSGKIVSNYFGLGSFAIGLETQAKGIASVSQNMFTTSVGDYSHAEGYNTTSNGIASHSGGINSKANHTGEFVRSSGMFSKQGDAQYSIITAFGALVGQTETIIYVNGINENLKIPKNSITYVEVSVVGIVLDDLGKSDLEGEGFAIDGWCFLIKNINGTVTSSQLSNTRLVQGFTSGAIGTYNFGFTSGQNFGEYTELETVMGGSNADLTTKVFLTFNIKQILL